MVDQMANVAVVKFMPFGQPDVDYCAPDSTQSINQSINQNYF